MSSPFDAAPDPAADARWLVWKAHGAEGDRRTGAIMTWLFAIACAGALGWLAMQLL
jgi:hypothetical protein